MFALTTIILTTVIGTTTSNVVKLVGLPLRNYSKLAANYGLGALDDEVDWSHHPCKRKCEDDVEPKTCRYGFTIENYATLSTACYDCPFNVTDCFRPHCIPADGSITRTLIVVNRQLPGPSIEVCLGDRIIVDVSNKMMTDPTSLHWHGMHQRGTPFMDGVPMISQCPIEAGDSFRYDFKADNTGTFFWHGHSGLQRGDGLFGGLIVRTTDTKNKVRRLYDFDEHVIVISEWNNFQSHDAFVLIYHAITIVTQPHTILINGLGAYGDEPRTAKIPRHIIRVEKGKRYRIRLIHAGGWNCPMNLTIDQHPMLVVSADGADVEPVKVDAIHVSPAERYDFILDANQEIGNYWIRLGGLIDCRWKKVHQEAILRYVGADKVEPSESVGWDVGFQSENMTILNSEKENTRISAMLTSLEEDDITISDPPDHQFYLDFDFYEINAENYHRKDLYQIGQVSRHRATLQINHLSFQTPNFPLQTQPELIGSDYFCNVTEKKCTSVRCSCPYVLQIKLNTTVELVLVDEVSRMKDAPNQIIFNHPIHLHGYYFRVLAMKKLNYTTTIEQIRELDQAGKIHRKLEGAPLKDVIDVPGGGYTIVRFRADNPGYWYLHCHVDQHSFNGMAMVLKIGEHEDFPPVPKEFPKCFRHKTSLRNSNSSGSFEKGLITFWMTCSCLMLQALFNPVFL